MNRHYSKSDKASGWLAAGTLASAQGDKLPIIPRIKNPLKYYVRNPHAIVGLHGRALTSILGRALARIGELEAELKAKAESGGAK